VMSGENENLGAVAGDSSVVTDNREAERQNGNSNLSADSAFGSNLQVGSNQAYQTIDRYGFKRQNNAPQRASSARDVRLPNGGSETTDGAPDEDFDDGIVVDIQQMRRREAKWIEMDKNWDDYMLRDYKRVRNRCRKGIPTSVRSRAWTNLCGAKFLMEKNKGRFKELKDYQGHNPCTYDIEKDIHRNFPEHEMFGGVFERIGREHLNNVCRAYSLHNPKDGYSQAMAPVAALLLMNMPEEEAFWSLVSICERYIPGYYSPSFADVIQLDAAILLGLLKRVSPAAHKHLTKQEIDPTMIIQEWFLCVYSRTLPWPSVLRVWDMFMCEGVKVIFKVGLVLLKHTLTPKVMKSCPTMYETLTVLKELPAEVTAEEFLVSKVLALDVDEPEMKREHKRQLAARAKTSQNQQQRPRSRNQARPHRSEQSSAATSTTPTPGRTTTV